MKRFFYLLIFIFIFSNSISALSLLPRTAYLQYKDNGRDVVTLQRILNSDPDTKIRSGGAGSSGQENWYFGILTVDAVKRFQTKYNLEITGKINYKTLRQVNLVAQNFNNPTQTTKNIAVKEKPVKTIPDNPPSDNQYLDNNQNQPPPNASPTKKTFLDSTIVGTLVDKLRGLFGSGSSNSNTQNTNSQNPNNGSGICTQIAGQTGNTALGCGNGYGNTPNTSANPYTASPYSNSNANSPVMNALLANQQAQNPNQQPSGPVTAGSEVSAGRTSGTAGDIGECRATSFAHATLREGCKADSGDQQNDQHSASGQILSRSGVPAIPAVALPSAGSFGDAVEVKDMSTGKCKAFPLLDRGPGKGPLSKGVCIDLTGSAVDILKGREPCKTVGSEGEGMEGVDKVQYALVPGDKIPVGQTKECSHL